MAIRSGYADGTWALARAADVEALDSAAELLRRDYEGHRARAFALAVRGRADEALEALDVGCTEDWPSAESYGIDVARIHLLAGSPDRALTALALDARTGAHAEPEDVVTLVLDCVGRDPRLWRRGLGVARAGSHGLARAFVPARVLRRRLVPAIPGS